MGNVRLSVPALAIAALALGTLSWNGEAGARELIEFGPSGGSGGSDSPPCPLTFSSDGSTPAITEIRVHSGAMIDSIQLVKSFSGATTIGPRLGGVGGSRTTFKLAPDEKIVSVHGRYGRYVDHLVVATNRGRTMGWGSENGGVARFYYKAPKGMWISGFFGRSGKYLDAIGVCVTDPRP